MNWMLKDVDTALYSAFPGWSGCRRATYRPEIGVSKLATYQRDLALSAEQMALARFNTDRGNSLAIRKILLV